MLNVKKILSICLVFVMLVSFVACGDKKDIEDMSDEEIEEILEEMYGEEDTDTTQALANDGKVNIDEIIAHVNFKNFNGYGFVDISVWGTALLDRIPDESMKQYVESVAPDLAATKYSQGYKYYFNDIVKFKTVEEYNRLSNGDVVTVVATVADEFAERGVTLDSVKQGLGIDFDTEANYTVSGLMEGGKPLDIMSNIEQFVQYEGGDGKIKAKVVFPENYTFESNGFYFKAAGSFSANSLNVVYNNQQVSSLKFEIENKDYSTGDKYIVKIDNFENKNSSLVAYGAFLADSSKTFTIPQVGEYINSVEQLNGEQLEFIKNTLSTEIQSKWKSRTSVLKNFYAGTIKPTETLYKNSNFVLIGLFEVSRSNMIDGNVTEYYIAPIFDIIVKADGDITYTSPGIYAEEFETYAEAENYINVSGRFICQALN